jgi:hypothetical protein
VVELAFEGLELLLRSSLAPNKALDFGDPGDVLVIRK